jgi:TonB-linked SusC/RagA family outer membrane protein
MDGVIRYGFDVDKLNVQIMAGANQESYKYQWFQAGKVDLTAPELSVLDAATADATASGNMTNWALHSYFGRVNLNWQDKYLLEANLRMDASSRFARGSNRWGYFPSFSTGWRLSEEDFMKDGHFLDNLKLRFSWGSLGNNSLGNNRDNDGNYMYQALYASRNYILNDDIQIGFAQTNLSNANLTWETTYVTNIGVDYGLLNSRLNGSVDFFIKNTKGILIDLPAPLVHGTSSIPKQNAAEVRNKGVEIQLGWSDKTGEVEYFITGNISHIKNKVTKFKGEESAINGSNMILEGQPVNIQYVRSVDRLIQTDEDLAIVQSMIEKNPNAFSAYGKPEKGDFLYKDLNKDGLVNDEDRMMAGNGTNPTLLYGLSLGAGWKGIDFSCLFQGVGGLKVHWRDDYFTPSVRHGYQINKEIAQGRWYEGRTDAIYPRLLEYSNNRNIQASDFWIQDKSYLKLKNIQAGYTFPKSFSHKILLEILRVYGSVENAFTVTKYKGLDPEVDGTQYPTLRMITLGINLTF